MGTGPYAVSIEREAVGASVARPCAVCCRRGALPYVHDATSVIDAGRVLSPRGATGNRGRDKPLSGSHTRPEYGARLGLRYEDCVTWKRGTDVSGTM